MLSSGFLWGCSPAPSPAQNDAIEEEIDAITGADIRPVDIHNPRDSFSDIVVEETNSHEVQTDISFSDVIEWLDALADVIKPEAPRPPKAELFSELPCGFPASIRIDEESERAFVTCGAAKGSLQERSLSGGVNSAWSSFEEFDGYPSNHMILPGGFHLVTRSYPDGFVLIDEVTREISDEIVLSEEDITDKDGEPLAFLPNMPSGAALIDDNICIATSNMDHIDGDPTKSTYNDGTLLCFPYDGMGHVTHGNSTAYYTSGINPTALASIDTDKIATLSSNGYNPSQSTHVAVDIFTFPAAQRNGYEIIPDNGGSFTGIISPDMPVSEDGFILVGLQEPSDAVIGLNPENGETLFDTALDGVENFISSLQIFGNIVVASDFGPNGGAGKVIFFNLDENGWRGTVETKLPANPGPATIFNGVLYQTVTGAIYTLDLSGMN